MSHLKQANAHKIFLPKRRKAGNYCFKNWVNRNHVTMHEPLKFDCTINTLHLLFARQGKKVFSLISKSEYVKRNLRNRKKRNFIERSKLWTSQNNKTKPCRNYPIPPST
jgi:hypothetical protein